MKVAAASPVIMIIAIAAWLSLTAAVSAQNAGTALAYVYPAGGQRSTTFRVIIGGQRLAEITAAHFSDRGISAKIVDNIQPPKQEEVDEYMDELRELAKRKLATLHPGKSDRVAKKLNQVWTGDDEERLMVLAEMAATFSRFREAPAVAHRVILEVTVAADAALGRRELRLESPLGLSNPMIFMVGDIPEISKPPLSARAVVATVGERRFAQWRRFLLTPEPTLEVSLPTVINGQIGPGERDVVSFKARKGQRIVVAIIARELSPYLADAVPGWFDAFISLTNADGQELAAADSWRFHPDPVMCHEIPQDGQYFLEIRDSIYRGREDFVYRITLGEIPMVTAVFPLGGQTGTTTKVTLRGWNLARTSMEISHPMTPGLYPICKNGRFCQSTPFARMSVDTLPECLENSSPGRPRSEQDVNPPVIINGQILQAGESDVYSFTGRTGQTMVVEVMARRLGSPLDSFLKITDAAGTVLATNDDSEDKGAGLLTHHADSRVSVVLPADGLYRVHLTDIQGKAGDAYAYRLRIGEPRPDFELRITPSVINLRRGATMPFTAHVIRRDGFAGEIALSLLHAPDGFVLSGGRIPPGQNQISMTLSSSRTSSTGPIELQMQGCADISGRQVVHPAVPAEDMMQAFAWRFLVPTETLTAFVSEGKNRSAKLASPTNSIRIPQNGFVMVPVGTSFKKPPGNITFELKNPPKGITLTKQFARAQGAEIMIHADADVRVGLKGNLLVVVAVERVAEQPEEKGLDPSTPATNPPTAKGTPSVAATKPTPARPAKKNRRESLGTLPAIPFEIVPASSI
jgi:hypothetical protein